MIPNELQFWRQSLYSSMNGVSNADSMLTLHHHWKYWTCLVHICPISMKYIVSNNYCMGFTLKSDWIPEQHMVCCRIQDTEAKYYADGEDAYDMRKTFAVGSEVQNRASTGSTSKSWPRHAAAAAHARSCLLGPPSVYCPCLVYAILNSLNKRFSCTPFGNRNCKCYDCAWHALSTLVICVQVREGEMQLNCFSSIADEWCLIWSCLWSCLSEQ